MGYAFANNQAVQAPTLSARLQARGTVRRRRVWSDRAAIQRGRPNTGGPRNAIESPPTMDELFTAPPWSADPAGRLYARAGQPGSTEVATLEPGAPARLLAAAPALLQALDAARPLLEAQMHQLSGPRMVAMLTARNAANDAIVHARIGVRGAGQPTRLWRMNEALPAAEREANERLLIAADELHEAVKGALAALAGENDHPAIHGALAAALASVGHRS